MLKAEIAAIVAIAEMPKHIRKPLAISSSIWIQNMSHTFNHRISVCPNFASTAACARTVLRAKSEGKELAVVAPMPRNLKNKRRKRRRRRPVVDNYDRDDDNLKNYNFDEDDYFPGGGFGGGGSGGDEGGGGDWGGDDDDGGGGGRDDDDNWPWGIVMWIVVIGVFFQIGRRRLRVGNAPVECQRQTIEEKLPEVNESVRKP